MTNIQRLTYFPDINWSPIARKLLAFLVMTLLFIVTGPQDTNYLDVHTRAEYWFIWTALIWLCLLLVSAALSKASFLKTQPSWARAIAEFSVGLIPCAVVSAALTASMFPYSFEFDFKTVLEDALFVSPILAAILLEFHGPRETVPVSATHPSGAEDKSKFLSRLSDTAGLRLIRIEVTDHYLEVKTTRRTEVILMNLKQAAAELREYDGMQVHRSHWVSFEQIERKFWQNGRLFLTLSNGDIVPVSRSFRKDLLKHMSANRGAKT